MENSVWTIFHRSGEYSSTYAPFWERYVCWGGTARILRSAAGDGTCGGRITLRLAERSVRLTDVTGRCRALSEANIAPGDLLVPGEADVPERGVHWRITMVEPVPGSGMVCGLVITAE